jgi:hypothetical protein
MLAAQMAAVHNATMSAARRSAKVENIQQQDSASTMLNKCARTFAYADATERAAAHRQGSVTASIGTVGIPRRLWQSGGPSRS